HFGIIEMRRLTKFMQTMEQELYQELQRLAKERGITLQELLRAIIIPEWFKFQEAAPHGGGRRLPRRIT
ncbi:hypothetical protein J2P12_04110, partial [Candidatus Bathyarchaeota archaeon]|nr:hypothetical protein [Candidatus Bathyarchaeota archaeon]